MDHSVGNPFCQGTQIDAHIFRSLTRLYRSGGWVAQGTVEQFPSCEFYRIDKWDNGRTTYGTIYRRYEGSPLCLPDFACTAVPWSSTH